eukprot:6310173-Prorocentrum_lima.AAC.1
MTSSLVGSEMCIRDRLESGMKWPKKHVKVDLALTLDVCLRSWWKRTTSSMKATLCGNERDAPCSRATTSK